MEHKLSCGVVVVRQTNDGWMTIVGEETGIADLEFDWGDRFFETGPYSKGKVARYYLGKTRQEEIVMGISPETGEPEHHEWRWVSFDEAYDLGSPRVRGIVQWARQVVGA
jgi:8-oxo-dGTP pyrophosphatase MutT (NUDIX family)